MRALLWKLAGFLPLFFAALAFAGEEETLYFKTGDKLDGISQGFENGMLRWETASGAVLMVPLEAIERVDYTDVLPAPVSSGDWVSEAELACDPDENDEQGYLSPVTEVFTEALDLSVAQAAKWTNRIEFGGQFISGNSSQDSITLKANFENTKGPRFTQLEMGGQWGRAEGQNTANRWFGNLTHDWNKEGNWILFFTAKNEYDQFENLDYRGIYSSGVGYRFYNEKVKRLITRIGPGMTYERFIDPNDTRTSPDLFGEVEFRWPLFDRMEVEHKTTINPSVEDFQIFRVVSNYGISLRLDESAKWNFKLGLRHEYNSKPNNNREKSDYTTNILLVYSRK